MADEAAGPDLHDEAPRRSTTDWDGITIEADALDPDEIEIVDELTDVEDDADDISEDDDDNPYQDSDDALPDDEEEAALRRDPSGESGRFDDR